MPEHCASLKENSEVFASLGVMFPCVTLVGPAFVNVTAWADDDLPIRIPPNSTSFVDAFIEGTSTSCSIAVEKCGFGAPAYSAIVQNASPSGSREIPL